MVWDGYILKRKSLVYLYTGLRWLHTERKVFSLLVQLVWHGYILKGKSLVYMYIGLRWLYTEKEVFSLLVQCSEMVTYWKESL